MGKVSIFFANKLSLFLLLVTFIVLLFRLLGIGPGRDKFSSAENIKNENRRKRNIYYFLNQNSYISRYMKMIKKRLYLSHNLDESSLIKKTISVILKAFFTALLTFIALVILIDINIYNFILISAISVFIFKTLIYKYTVNDTEFLIDLAEGCKDLKHFYASEKSIKKAYALANLAVKASIKPHFEKILEILNSNDQEGDLQRYYSDCPNKYLKIIAAYSYLTLEHGDEDSLFNRNINYLITDIRNNYRSKRKLEMSLFGVKFIILLPVFVTPMLKNYFISFFKMPGLSEFYMSSLGYLTMFLCIGISLFCYMIYSEIMKDRSMKMNIRESSWEDKALRSSFIKKLVDRIKPRKNSKKYKNQKKSFRAAGIVERSEWFYLKKIFCSVCVLCILSLLFITSNRANQSMILESTTYSKDSLYQQNIQRMYLSEDANKKRIKVDKDILKKIEENKELLNDEKALKEFIKTLIKDKKLDFAYIEQVEIDRIYSKAKDIFNRKYWPQLIIIAVFSYLAFFIPNINLWIARLIRKTSMMDEVMSYQTIVLLLMHHKTTTAKVMIEWFIWFSDVFYEPLVKAKNNFSDSDKGGINALRILQSEVKEFRPMERLVSSLIISSSKLSFKDAFADIEDDRRSNENLRSDNNEMIVNAKLAVIQRLANISPGFMIVFYVAVPIAYAAYKLLMQMSTITKSF